MSKAFRRFHEDSQQNITSILPKTRIFCPSCLRPKILFESSKKAENFIRYNAKNIPHGYKLRVYHCDCCGGWHLSSKDYKPEFDERMNLLTTKNYGRRINL